MQFSSVLEWVLNVMAIGAALATAAYEAGCSPEPGRWKSKHSMSFVRVNLLGPSLSSVFLGQFICIIRPVT